MIALQRFSEGYSATGGLAAEGIINQLGRPNIEPLEVLVREAVQNCWDAKRGDARGIHVEIGRLRLDPERISVIRSTILPDAPRGLPLGDELRPGLVVMHFADFGTSGLGGPTRADQVDGTHRDFVDFVRNIGQPPDKDLAGGSFGYGKAAFYIASRARTIVVDTLCAAAGGRLERRLIGCALGAGFHHEGRPYTGRHWWGRIVDGVPEPLLDAEADEAAALLGLPARAGLDGLGTTIAVVAPGVMPATDEGEDVTMPFIADALAWNFWPRMITTPGAADATMRFTLRDGSSRIPIPDPRTHPRLRGFAEAMDRLRLESVGDDDFTLDREVTCLRPNRLLGRLIIQKGVSAPVLDSDRPMPEGARETLAGVHHVALMRNAELVVKYLRGAVPVTGRTGYSGVFRCATTVDDAFRAAEPPTHDDWVYRAIEQGYNRTYVKVALERIQLISREAAGYSTRSGFDGDDTIPLGELADALATLMAGLDGQGARRTAQRPPRGDVRPDRPRPLGRSVVDEAAAEVWVDGTASDESPVTVDATSPPVGENVVGTSGGEFAPIDAAPGAPPVPDRRARSLPAPQTRSTGQPGATIATDGTPVVRYPFEVRAHGNRIRLVATVEIMTGDGNQAEAEPPVGGEPPMPRAWVTPSGEQILGATPEVAAENADGRWTVDVPIVGEALMRILIEAVAT